MACSSDRGENLELARLSGNDFEEKEFLCCLGERKRLVKYKVNPTKGDLKSALEAARTVFAEVITPTCEIFLQLKHENWSGEFVDISEMDSIPDKSVICCCGEAGVCGACGWRECVPMNLRAMSSGL